ncbi:MAG: MarR family transcriptional regulator [Opitutaceae bacterium]|jgi:DNA-binding MarR family transcriptional regulator
MLRERRIDTNPAQGRVLFVLWEEGPLPIYELAKRVSLGKSTLTSTLDRLEAKGQVLRIRSQEDRRKIVIQLTPENAAMRTLYEDVSREMTKLFYRGIADREIDTFEAMLSRILGNLDRDERPCDAPSLRHPDA